MNGIFFGGGVNLAILHKIEPYKQILEKNYVMQPFDLRPQWGPRTHPNVGPLKFLDFRFLA